MADNVTGGYNRPIPQQAMRTIETQLMQHIDTQRKRKEEEEELLQLDPWDITLRYKQNSNPSDDITNCNDRFYSFDLNNSTSDVQQVMPAANYPRPPGTAIRQRSSSKTQDYSHVAMSDGVGLQQLSLFESPSQSPRTQRQIHNNIVPTGKPLVNTEHDACHYSLVLSGLTIALLETNPIHTYSTDQFTAGSGSEFTTGSGSGNLMNDSELFESVHSHFSNDSLSSNFEYCSIDEGGLDPGKYFVSVQDILHGRVGKHDIERHQEQLGRVLPADHLL